MEHQIFLNKCKISVSFIVLPCIGKILLFTYPGNLNLWAINLRNLNGRKTGRISWNGNWCQRTCHFQAEININEITAITFNYMLRQYNKEQGRWANRCYILVLGVAGGWHMRVRSYPWRRNINIWGNSNHLEI